MKLQRMRSEREAKALTDEVLTLRTVVREQRAVISRLEDRIVQLKGGEADASDPKPCPRCGSPRVWL